MTPDPHFTLHQILLFPVLCTGFPVQFFQCPARCLQASFSHTWLTQYILLFISASAQATWTHLEVIHCKRPMDTKESLTQKSQWLQGSSCWASQQHALHKWIRGETEMINLLLLSMHKAVSSKLWKGPDSYQISWDVKKNYSKAFRISSLCLNI